ncbi:zinc finger protein RFP-like [Sceloporus undulatus]|uniref:zinc finger protein RFP-like n=1 Tax=Sceloporus undulatus TaxID=8520 RepID=UPI001C4BAACE|nr:zinc finger protein RFP-like [Sceloporus undulatus]
MDVWKAVKYIQEEATCPICLELFKEPVILDCGHNFCRACISRCQQEPKRKVSCPECRQSFVCANLRPNRQLGNILGLLKQFRVRDVESVEETVRLCESHQKPVWLFCSNDRVLLCLGCTESNPHRGHLLMPLEEAAQAYKDEIHTLLEGKKKKREEVLKYFSSLGEQRYNLEKLMEHGTQKMVLEYMQLGEVMKSLQAEVRDLAKLMERDFDSRLSKLLEEASHIETQVVEMERVCKQPAYEFLQGIKETLNKWEAEALGAPECVSPELKEKLWDLYVRSLFIEDTLRKCTETLPLTPKVEKAKVTLDPATAHPLLALSEDGKKVKHGLSASRPTASSQGFDSVPCVLGCEAITSGRHYWDVEITDEGGNWSIGVIKGSVERKGEIDINMDGGIWALEPESSHFRYRRGATITIRVFVDYEGGRVAFFDVSSGDFVSTLVPADFGGESIFPFFMLSKVGTQAKVCP